MYATDTIVALSTPYGRSGIGVIRLSGPRSLELIGKLLREDAFAPQPNFVSLKTLFDPETDSVIDRALITYFKSPHSFTGEDVAEISCHGSPPLLLHVVDALLRLGARSAEPGEFTMRALANGRMNLSQAEAVRDLIDAQTLTAVQQAARQLGGEMSSRLQPIKDELIGIIVPLESALEFVEDDLPDDVTDNVSRILGNLISSLEKLSNTFRSGRLLKEGLKVALVGRPNVGKSSVFNSLLAKERAIVTDIPGTTRDSLSEIVNIGGIPVLLIDTAGVRTSTDEVERLGIERTRQAIVDADLVVVILDGSQPSNQEDREVLANASKTRYLIALNKSDLKSFREENAPASNNGTRVISVSAKSGEGLNELSASILEPFLNVETQGSDFLITNARHFDLLRRATVSLQASRTLIEQRSSEEVTLTGLYEALGFLGQITGETTPDDVLTQIFSTFCIGK